MMRPSLADEIAAVRAVCRALGLGEVAPAPLKAAHHTSLLLPPLDLVARVQSTETPGVAWQRAERELAVTRHLAGRGAPAIAPLAEALAGPHVAGSSVVTLWPYLAHARIADEGDAPLAAAALAALHRGLRGFDGALPPHTETLDRCRAVLDGGGASAALPAADRDLLGAHHVRLRREVETDPHAWVPLHGDAHPGNLLLGRDGPVWLDFEDACLGPPESDIAALPAAAWPCFADADQALIARFADLKSVCVAIWCWADAARSDEIAEAADYHLERVRKMGCRSRLADEDSPASPLLRKS